MNCFLKKNKLWLGFLAAGVVIIILAFIFKPESIHYQIGISDSVKLLNDQTVLVDIKDLEGKQVIDIRPADLYAQAHSENAINIPIRKLLDKESLQFFNQMLKEGREVVLYGSDELEAVAPCLLLHQLGYKNVKHLRGGINETVSLKETELASTEVSVIDTAPMPVKTEVIKAAVIQPAKKKPEVVVPVKQEVSSGGGC